MQRAVLQSQLQAENSLIDAQDSYDSALDDFKLLVGMPVQEPLEVVGIELDVTAPDLSTDPTTLALKYRLDLQTTRDQIDDARRRVQNTKNDLLPDLNLTADSTIANRPGRPARELDAHGVTYSAGVSLDLPLDRVAERNAYRAALIDLERRSETTSRPRMT